VRTIRDQRGTASVEQAALAALVALLMIAALSAIAAAPPERGGRALGATIGRRIVCAPRLPDACRHHPLVRAYGWPLARLARALAPAPLAKSGPLGLALVPVDFRYCRRPSCAVPRPGAEGLHLTSAGRRTTVFTSIADRRRSGGLVEISYWIYRPGLGWERQLRRAGATDVAAASGVEVLLQDDPNLVPLETIPGRDQYEFPAGEQPPWRWKLQSVYPG
jgi:hypothetical protein